MARTESVNEVICPHCGVATQFEWDNIIAHGHMAPETDLEETCSVCLRKYYFFAGIIDVTGYAATTTEELYQEGE